MPYRNGLIPRLFRNRPVVAGVGGDLNPTSIHKVAFGVAGAETLAALVGFSNGRPGLPMAALTYSHARRGSSQVSERT